MLTRDHTVLPATHTFIHKLMEWTIPAFTLQPQSITALWPVLISVSLRVGGWVGLGALVKYWGGMPVRRRSPIPVLTGPDVSNFIDASNDVTATLNIDRSRFWEVECELRGLGSSSSDVQGRSSHKTGSEDRIPRCWKVFSERELTFTFAICYRPSVCRLSVVCL